MTGVQTCALPISYKASCLNVRHSVQEIEKSLCIHNIKAETGLRVVGAMYHIEDGSVEFL